MPAGEVLHRGQHVMAVCNACRYCEQYCPVFPAMERRTTFATVDLNYLANLCHNCGECLYACQYAPPHEFAINVPRTLAEIRLQSYEAYCWPRFLGLAFKRHNLLTGLGLAATLTGLMSLVTLLVNGRSLPRPTGAGNFYAVMPHHVMVTLFGGIFLFVLAALSIGVARFWRDIRGQGVVPSVNLAGAARALGDALTLRHLHGGGADCTSAEERRTPWRRWFHHCTFYGFLFCFVSTCVAAMYRALGWNAPYPSTSAPVLFGTIGGAGLLVGPFGLLLDRRRRDRALGDLAQVGLDSSFIALLSLAAFTGLVLLVFRREAVMSALLLLHLGVVLALFITLPYGKFVHGLYRTAALLKYAKDDLNA